MIVRPNASNGKRPTLAVIIPQAKGQKHIELCEPEARHLMTLINAGVVGARLPAAAVERLIELGLEIIVLCPPFCHAPGVYRLMTPVDAAWME